MKKYCLGCKVKFAVKDYLVYYAPAPTESVGALSNVTIRCLSVCLSHAAEAKNLSFNGYLPSAVGGGHIVSPIGDIFYLFGRLLRLYINTK